MPDCLGGAWRGRRCEEGLEARERSDQGVRRASGGDGPDDVEEAPEPPLRPRALACLVSRDSELAYLLRSLIKLSPPPPPEEAAPRPRPGLHSRPCCSTFFQIERASDKGGPLNTTQHKKLIALWLSRFEGFCCRIASHCRSIAIRAGTQAAVCVREVCAQATRTTRSGALNDVRWTAAGLPCLTDDVQPRQLLEEHEIAPQDKCSVLRVGGKQGLREAEEEPPEPTQKVRGLCGRDS
jgi:hypothetical protein